MAPRKSHRNLLGIDLGTSSVKAVVINDQGATCGFGSQEYPIDMPSPGWAEQNPEAWWKATVHAVRKAVQQSSVPIQAIGFSGQMHGVVLMGTDDKPARPAIIWPDQRSFGEVRTIISLIGTARLAAITGTLPACGFMAPTLLWLLKHEPACLENARYCFQPKDYLRLRMTGEAASETTDASATALFDIKHRQWSRELIRLLHLPEHLFLPVLASSEPAGRLSKWAADELLLDAGTLVVAGCADQVAQASGNGLLDPGEAFIAVGSGGQILVPLDTPKTDPELRFHCFCHAPPERWYALGAMLTAGLSLRWLRDLLDLTNDKEAYHQLSSLAGTVEPSTGSVLFLPYLAGERSPLMDPNARGCFIGLSLSHNRAHLGRAILEGVCFAIRQILETMLANGISADRIFITGKGMDSPLWRQMLADILGRPLHRRQGIERTAVGAALIAGIGAKILSGYPQIKEIVYEMADATLPKSDNAAVYEKRYDFYKSAYPQLRSLFAAMGG